MNAKPALDLAQVFVKLATQVGQNLVVQRLK
jgi:hypothetical protein